MSLIFCYDETRMAGADLQHLLVMNKESGHGFSLWIYMTGGENQHLEVSLTCTHQLQHVHVHTQMKTTTKNKRRHDIQIIPLYQEK